MKTDGRLNPPPNAGYAELVDGFKTGLTAMMLHHVGSSSIWLETFGDDVDAFVMPGTEKGQWTCTGDTELVVYEQCKDSCDVIFFSGELGYSYILSHVDDLKVPCAFVSYEEKDILSILLNFVIRYPGNPLK